MIHEVDELLEKLVKRDALNGSSVELVFASGELNWFTTWRPPEFGSVAFANTPRNWSFAVCPRTSATPTAR